MLELIWQVSAKLCKLQVYVTTNPHSLATITNLHILERFAPGRVRLRRAGLGAVNTVVGATFAE